ncbi:DNA repair ATPase [Luteolibacter pohnpeiensis]|uniref:DNA repair ATPase n=1 Tax=Luteolibacter pohnpeiensis TaxID=454153 RepID=A0A934S7F4_9BACT|nr:DNA repair ATPase [Luteolibacter pohnpeiensis]MBK1881097.1 DNA repair ATPase [Luteolibacter pohnpeiensis]
MSDAPQQLEGGAYEVIRARLDQHATVLRERIEQLNAARQDVFGAIPTALLSTGHIATSHNCVPRDIIGLGNDLYLLGFNIQFGLKQTMELEDVFALYRLEPEGTFHPVPLGEVLTDKGFVEDFNTLFRYYREAVFIKFMVIGPHLHMKMRIGKTENDFKTFKWLLNGDGSMEYQGNRSDHECRFPETTEFQWTRAHRDMHRSGEHPHISIEDRVFVETVGGDLTVKIEDNTKTGEGIYAEPVTDSDQTLDDAEIHYAIIGSLIVLRVLPYREELHRYLVFNEKTKAVHRLDGIGESCVLLPEDQGLLFANGYILATGEVKTFETGLSKLRFERRLLAGNGEDTLFVFYQQASGHYVLLSYNVIAQQVETPMVCNGFAIAADGRMVQFKAPDQPQKHHALQLWQTPYAGDSAVAVPEEKRESLLFKVGNANLVHGMAEAREILILFGKGDTYANVYLDLVKRSREVLDTYFWLNQEETKNLAEPLQEINAAANSAIEEFDKVQRLRQATAARSNEVRAITEKLLKAVRITSPDDIRGFVRNLADLRMRRGEIIGLRELRYVDLQFVESLDQQVTKATDEVSKQTADFLMRDEALDPYRKAIEEQHAILKQITKTTEADEVAKALDQAGSELELLIDIVGNLRIEDPTQTTAIIENISALYATLNGIRAELKSKRRELAQSEGVAQFGAQMKLLGQAVVNFIDLCDTPEKCDEYLTKVMVQVEELEGRFADFDEYVDQLSRKREEVYEAFEGRKQSLLEQRGRRAGNLMKSAERILSGVKNRADSQEDLDAINGYFAGDLMVSKLRDIISELRDLGDTVKSDDLQTRLKTLQSDAIRQLRDRKELFAGGKDVLQFGKHRFSVNTQELALSIVPHEEGMAYHLSGTGFFEPVTDERFLATREVWDQQLISENRQVYRVEWLIHRMLQDGNQGNDLEAVHAFMSARYAEGYTKGVHDEDAVKLLTAIRPIHDALGLLKFGPRVRTLAMLFWEVFKDTQEGSRLAPMIASHGAMRRAFGTAPTPNHPMQAALQRQLSAFLTDSAAASQIAGIGEHAEPVSFAAEAAGYLFEQLAEGGAFAASAEAAATTAEFKLAMDQRGAVAEMNKVLTAFEKDAERRFLVIFDWMAGQLKSAAIQETQHGTSPLSWVAEAAAHWLRGGIQQLGVIEVVSKIHVSGLRGQHPMIGDGGVYETDYHAFRDRLMKFERHDLPAFEACAGLKQQLTEEKRESLKLDEFKPRVMSSFVRNQLINEVYLPLIGDNLAKQIGTAGVDTRTDRSGLLLLVSPPGYGKTTIMEYVANRLGLTFMKINGPALGHGVVSLDPTEAPNLSAREEVDKLNLALEMGDNVMIYVDDIQHTNPEFLQRFISLCDGQRKMEGVWRGKARTYDLRGKKVAVVMAGNPYTEGGAKFKIPDMLANRADTYNLGDILGGHLEAFKASYIENSLTSNKVMAKLASRHQEDIYTVMKIAATGSQEGIDFKGNYAPAEIEEMVKVTRHLFEIRDTILQVNQEYIRSAAQEDAYRTEPPFKLQGSYRNMNRIAEKILPLMTLAEVRSLILDHYQNESQTLTQGAEANLLKFKEFEGIANEKEIARWTDIKKEFMKRRLLGGSGENDPVARVVAQLSAFQDGLDSIRTVIAETGRDYIKPQTLAETTVEQLRDIIAGLRAVPVEVDIKVVPVQEQNGPIQSLDGNDEPPIDIKPEVRQNVGEE